MNYYNYHRILVTGGAGFIGANLIRQLRDHGKEIVVVDNLSVGRNSYLDGVDVQFHRRDIRQLDEILPCFTNVDAVIHLAAFGNVVDSVQTPIDNFRVNAQGTLNVLEAARLSNVRKFVFASTGGALMGNATPPVNEKSVPQPISPYGASKLTGEGYCSAYAASYGMKTVCCRFANVYGKYSAHKQGVITRYIKEIHEGRFITIYGDGTSVRDYIYVEDLCNGIILSLNKDTENFDIFHLATGQGTSISQLADAIYRHFPNKVIPIKYEPVRVGEVDKNFAIYDKAQEKLGFKPETSLPDGLEKTIKWYKEHVL
ncbi:NAD-dependent epimerase/dehydratase family protein [Rhodanobacter ginsengisoli]|uniref:NAD-dependent epimerase/dehydratase family protein n=1 Tax=Rhodanobacter ginsengisoli TaxID=418646 RepID=A0ABW0QQJ7_9GAMM